MISHTHARPFPCLNVNIGLIHKRILAPLLSLSHSRARHCVRVCGYFKSVAVAATRCFPFLSRSFHHHMTRPECLSPQPSSPPLLLLLPPRCLPSKMDSSPVFDLYDFIAEPDTAVYATAMPSNSSHHSYHNGANGANIGDTPVASFNGVRDGLYSQSSIPSSHPTAADGSRYHHPHHLQINQPSVSPFYLHHMQNVSYIDNAQLLNQSPYTPPTNRLVDSPFIHHENGAFRPTSSFNTLPASSVPSSSSFVAHHPHNDGNPINFSFSTNNTPTPNITTTNTITNTVVPLITNVPSGYHPQDHQPMQGQEALDVVDHHHQVKHETLGNKTCGRGAENSPSTTVSHSKKDQLMGRKCRIRFDFRDPLLSSVYQFLENVSSSLLLIRLPESRFIIFSFSPTHPELDLLQCPI